MKKWMMIIYSLFVLTAATGLPSLAIAADNSATRLTTGTSVRLRSEPKTSAKEVVKLPLGTPVIELEKSTQLQTVAGKKDFWYRVATSEGKEGWLFGGFTTVFDRNKPAEIYLNIANAQFKAKKPSFTDLLELWDFLTRTSNEVTQGEKAAELKLLRLQVLQRSLRDIPYNKEEKPPYKEWLRERQPDIGYSEPTGEWLVKPDKFWSLQQQYSRLPIGERIAWEAANHRLGGECEGYFPCYLGKLNLTTGKYLSLYPQGKYVETALRQMIEQFTSMLDERNNLIMPEPQDKEAIAELQTESNQLRKTVGKTSHPKKTTVLKLLDQLISSKPQN